MPLILLNPEITNYSRQTESGEEGCLSFPGMSGPVPRARTIDLRFMDLDGHVRELVLSGFLARVVQHEVDHLNGVLFIDRMSAVKKIALSGRLKKLRKQTQQNLATV